MRILLIEDELPAARQLTKLLLAYNPDFQVIDTLDSVEQSVRWLTTHPQPDLIFMDIQIADGLSFDIFRQVQVTSPVIFTTAFDQYAVQAFRVNAVDYLLKPIDVEYLGQALQKIENQTVSPQFDLAELTRFFRPVEYRERFLVKNGQHFSYIQTADVAWFRSSDGLTQAYCTNGKKYLVDHPLDDLERVLDPKQFFRVNRHLTLCVQSIQKIHPHLNGRLKLDLTPDAHEEVFVSRDRVPEFKAWLGG
jgi:DNA-binding LytR/AlgR family response regulator